MAVNQPCAPPLRVTALFAASCARLAPLAVPLTPAPGLVMPNASGCAAAGSFSPACRLDASSSLGQSQCGAPVCVHQIQRPRTDFPCIGVGIQSRAPLHLWRQRLIDFPRVRVSEPLPLIRATVHAFATISLAFASGFMTTLPLIDTPQHLIDFHRVHVGEPSPSFMQWCMPSPDFPRLVAFASGFMSTRPVVNVPQLPINFPRVRVGEPLPLVCVPVHAFAHC